MKKIFVCIFVTLLLESVSLFANSDIQINTGYHLDTANVKQETRNYGYGYNTTANTTSGHNIYNGYNCGVTNYNLFDIHPTQDILSVGFMESVFCSVAEGNGPSVSVFEGAAIGVALKNIVKAQVSLGVNIGYSGVTDYMSAGFALDAQIKFLPQNRISPVIGYRFMNNAAGGYSNDNYTDERITYKNVNSHDIYVAFCINLGRLSKSSNTKNSSSNEEKELEEQKRKNIHSIPQEKQTKQKQTKRKSGHTMYIE